MTGHDGHDAGKTAEAIEQEKEKEKEREAYDTAVRLKKELDGTLLWE